MYRLLIVDDEEIEREGMTHFIPWEKHGVTLVGAAWNGIEAFEMIERLRPDIVLTDIRMPVMNGIELIRKTRAHYPDIEFVVLSGYSDYEFTSQAMEEGVRHYVLKPCDEGKVVAVLDKLKEKIERERGSRRERQEVERELNRLLPRAGEQLLRNLLLGREAVPEDRRLFQAELGRAQMPVRVMAARQGKDFDYTEQFVIGNMMRDLLPEGALLLVTGIAQDVLLLVRDCALRDLDWAAARLQKEFTRFEPGPLALAVSEAVTLDEVHAAYGQTQDLLRAGQAAQPGVLLTRERIAAGGVFDYAALRAAESYPALLFELTLARIELERQGAPFPAVREQFALGLRLAGGAAREGGQDAGALGAAAADTAAAARGMAVDEGARSLFGACFGALCLPEASVSYIAQELLFISQGYFSRQFARLTGQKFSAWLEETRIALARRLLEHDPDIRVGELAQAVGYAPDGQYFSKAFRKVTGLPPSEWRERCLRQS